jgi:predicted transcriptional regulator
MRSHEERYRERTRELVLNALRRCGSSKLQATHLCVEIGRSSMETQEALRGLEKEGLAHRTVGVMREEYSPSFSLTFPIQ